MNKIEKVAEQLRREKEYFASEDFKSMYVDLLLEDLDYAVSRLVEISQKEWDIIEDKPLTLDDNSARYIIEYVRENIDDYVYDYSMYYVGYESVDSIDFGEQEVPLIEKIEHTDDDIEGFYIDENGEYAYYDLTSNGVHIKISQLECYDILEKLNLI